MKKNIIKSLLVAIIVLVLTNRLWYRYYPKEAVLEISGQRGICSFMIRLAKNNSKDFKKAKTGKAKNVDISKSYIIKLDIKRLKSYQKARLVIYDIYECPAITINKLILPDGNNALKNINDIQIDNAEYKIEDSKITIYPKDKDIDITFNNIKSYHNLPEIDFMFCITTLILLFFTFYKLNIYFSKITLKKKENIPDAILLVIFFILLLIPAHKINWDNISIAERRYLAKWKPLIQNKQINYKFGKDFENWFNDRYYKKQKLVEFYNTLLINIAKQNNNGIVDDKTGFIYVRGEFDPDDMTKFYKSFEELDKFNAYLKNHNIKLYVLIVPSRGLIYPPEGFDTKNHDKFLKFLDEMKAKYNFKFVYAYDALKKGAEDKNNPVFYRTEHHWSDEGAFIGYQEVMKLIKKDYPQVRILNKDDFKFSYDNLVRGDFNRDYRYGTVSGIFGMSHSNYEKYNRIQNKYYTHKDAANLKTRVTDIKFHREKNYYYPKGENLRTIILGTSQSESMMEFFPYNFRFTKRLRNNTVQGIPMEEEFKIIKYLGKEIVDYKPDIVVFCISYGNISHLTDIFVME